MLCRSCGGEMAATEYCQACSEPVLWRCGGCQKESDKSIHTYHPEKVESVKVVSVAGALSSVMPGLLYVSSSMMFV